MQPLFRTTALVSLLLCGALFGFFYAWVCSTMWGLDAAAPEVAIRAMQAMNASVRNAVFAPVFFGTGPALLLAALLAWKSGQRIAVTGLLVAAGMTALLGGSVLTMAVNVPMNEALATVAIPENVEAAETIWQDYSPRWQFWNQLRTIASGIALIFSGIGLSKI